LPGRPNWPAPHPFFWISLKILHLLAFPDSIFKPGQIDLTNNIKRLYYKAIGRTQGNLNNTEAIPVQVNKMDGWFENP
jgi:hypothetical protein